MKKFYTWLMACLITSLPVIADETDVTAKYIKNPSFESQFNSWTQTNLQTQKNTSFTLKHGTYYVEKWVSSGSKVGNAEIYQTISKLPAGQYRLQAAAQNIQQEKTTKQTGAWIYAGSAKTTVQDADTYSVEFSTLGEALNIGFKASNATGNWICIDNFKLYYLGTDIAPLLALLQTQIEAAEATVAKANRTTPPLLQTSFMGSLTDAINAAKALDSNASADDIGAAAMKMDAANIAAQENYQAMSDLRSLNNKAKTYTAESKLMGAKYKETLQAASDSAQAILDLKSEANVLKATQNLQAAYDDAVASSAAYNTLNKQITSASSLNTTDKEGVKELEDAILSATEIRDRYDATPDEMNSAAEALETAILIFRVANGTGRPIAVRTSTIVEGATELFARAAFGSGSIKEKGLCWSSENPEPTIYDNRTTFSYSNNGDIYNIKDLTPATLYYVRAYAISGSYAVSYGDVVKIYTRPFGTTTFSYGNEGDEGQNTRIRAACEEGVWMWNNISGIQGFHLDAHYRYGAGAGDGTAECSYGGYMSVSQNTGCQRTGTILHEGAHGLGMVPYTDWTNSIYRSNGDRGDWLGPRVDRIIQFLENSSSAKLHGDTQHMWPYGINGAGEDSGSPILYRGNALLVGALAEDGIRTPNQNFLRPAYSFPVEDEVKYYIKNADENRGLMTSYLVVNANNTLSWKEMTSDEAFQNDSCAWTITYNPSTCYYQLKNVATERYMSYASTGNNGIRTSITATNNSRFHLLSARADTKVGTYTFASRSYWLVAPSSQACLAANANGAIGAASFNHADGSTTQRWFLMTADEVARFGEANGETVGIRSLDFVEQGSLRVLGGQGAVSVTAVGTGADVNIYSVDGRLLRQLYVQQDAIAHIRLPRGIYIVGDQKVTVR